MCVEVFVLCTMTVMMGTIETTYTHTHTGTGNKAECKFMQTLSQCILTKKCADSTEEYNDVYNRVAPVEWGW